MLFESEVKSSPCAHEWLSETQYRLRRCKHCGAHPFDDALARLRYRAHRHVGDASGRPRPPGPTCYGSYEPCGEHHAHDETCGSRYLICRRPDDPDAVALLEWIEARLPEATKENT
jgi:hypothetical protein